MSTEVSVSADGLRREFGTLTALDGVDFTIDGPEIVGVAGPNGSGKTTLIRCLLGLLRSTDGEIRVDGTRPVEFDAADRLRLGYMPQHEAVYRELTVRQNVEFFARLYGVQHCGTAVDRALEFVALRDRADARIGELSGGMIRRTSLACAIVHDPDIMLLDEPTVGLDPRLREEMWSWFRRRRDDGTTALVSTHYLGEARHCDRVLFLRAGEVLAFDTPAGFLEATSSSDLEDAFLALLERDAPTGGSGGPRGSDR